MITARSRVAAGLRVAAVIAGVTVLVGATVAGDARRVVGHPETPGEARVACATQGVIVDITSTLGYPPWGELSGSGVLIRPGGEVLTNNHVVAGAARVSVRFSGGGRAYRAQVAATDVSDDLALLRVVGGAGLSAARLGDSSRLSVGQRVYAVGNGHGDCGTPRVTEGTITELDATTSVSDQLSGVARRLTGLIRTRIEVEPGDSGGALVDDSGEVVGILAAGGTAVSCDCYGAAFAIPIDKASAIAAQMAAGTPSATVHIGPAASLGVTAAGSSGIALEWFVKGALITYIAPGSPAARLGMALGDQIVRFGGRHVGCASDLTTLLEQRRPGESVRVRWTDGLWREHAGIAVLASGPPH